MILAKVVDLFTFKLPYYGLNGMTKVCGGRQFQIWNKLPFRNLKVLKIAPDANMIIFSLNDYGTYWDIYHSPIYDRFFKPQMGDMVVDAGAHIGIYTLKAAKAVGDGGRVIAVEPEDKNYELLTKNVRINKYQNVIPAKLALSDFNGKAKLFLKARSCSHSLVGKTWVTPIVGVTEVAVSTLDKFLEKLSVEKVDVLKVNVEGAELNLLKGSEEHLAEGRIFKMVLTTHPPYKQEANDIDRYLTAFGYSIKVADDARVLYAFLD
jgi:FkbM family methyltransferase